MKKRVKSSSFTVPLLAFSSAYARVTLATVAAAHDSCSDNTEPFCPIKFRQEVPQSTALKRDSDEDTWTLSAVTQARFSEPDASCGALFGSGTAPGGHRGRSQQQRGASRTTRKLSVSEKVRGIWFHATESPHVLCFSASKKFVSCIRVVTGEQQDLTDALHGTRLTDITSFDHRVPCLPEH